MNLTVLAALWVATSTANGNEPQPWIRFAGGAVEFQLPHGWIAAEVPMGREVHIVLSPTRQESGSNVTNGRIWLACHAAKSIDDRPVGLQQAAISRLAVLTNSRAKITRTESRRVAGRDGVLLAFDGMLPGEGTSVRGRHLTIDLGSAVCEMHLVAPIDEFNLVETAANALMKSLVLGVPAADAEPTTPHATDARTLLGTWKALRSRLYLDGQGNIAIEMDRPTVLSVSAATPPPAPPVRIVGQFVARGELLLVTWSDGSRLNYRWRISDNDLLLTDHDGNVSQLRRLVH